MASLKEDSMNYGQIEEPGIPANDQLRSKLMDEMELLGINTTALGPLTVNQLSDLLLGLNRMANVTSVSKLKPGEKHKMVLSSSDKEMLAILLHSNGDKSSLALSKELNIPLTTVQRRRKRLEQAIDISYSLKIEEFGLRMITFFLTVEGRTAVEVGKEALNLQKIVSVERMIGGNIDIEIKAIVATNSDIAKLSEQLKMITGVKELSWNERVSIVGKNSDIYASIIEQI